MKSESEVAQSCPTLSDPMDCSLPGSSVHGIFQARVLEWGAIAFSSVDIYVSLKKTGLPLEHKILNGSSAESQTSGGVHLPLNYLDYLEKQEKSQLWSCQFPLEQKRAT